MKILFLCPYPLSVAPSQRFRFEQYFDFLKRSGYLIRVNSLFSHEELKVINGPGKSFLKITYLSKGAIRRIAQLFTIHFDFIFIHREAYPIGPPFIEWLIAKVMRKKIIYDFDDAIWLTDKKNESWLEERIRWRSKVASICKWSYKVSAGNDYLCGYARQSNANVIKNPTTIDTELVHNKSLYKMPAENSRVIIGWTGSRTTLKYLYLLEDVLQHLQKKYDHVDLLVVADQPPAMKLERILFKSWSGSTEVSDLVMAHIGIMPLPDDEWSKGKCGFKALQYMALEIPAVISPVGVNTSIIQHGVNGFLCQTKDEWLNCLESLIQNKSLRLMLGKAGRKTVVDQYSVSSNSANFLSLFE